MATWRYNTSGSSSACDAEMIAHVASASASAAGVASASDAVTSERDDSTENDDDDDDDECSLDLSHSDLTEFPHDLLANCPALQLRSLNVASNQISAMPSQLGQFTRLVSLDVSNNRLKSIADDLCTSLQQLRSLVARNNCLTVETIPPQFGSLSSLAVLNLSGNQLTQLPVQFTRLPRLQCLYLGANVINTLPPQVENMAKLEILYLGGNRLSSLPVELGHVTSLVSLVLSDNQLTSLPRSLTNLHRLQSLSLHNNQLATLPPDIIRLPLVELSLRNNPLVVKFVEELTYDAPSLLELAGRCVKLHHVSYSAADIPASLVHYLDSAQSCVNPRCNGVYFTSRVEHVKFVDFCGKYRLPLMQYLCSPHCHSETNNTSSRRLHPCVSDDNQQPAVSNRLKTVLLG